MTPASKGMLAAGIVALGAITVGVLYGQRTVVREPDTDNARRFTVDWENGTPPEGDKTCLWTTALVSDQATFHELPDGGTLRVPSPLELYGARTDAGPQYVYARVCTLTPDENAEAEAEWMPLPDLPQGFEAIAHEQLQEPFDGGPQLLAVLQGEPEWPCACVPTGGADGGTDGGDDEGEAAPCERSELDWATWEMVWHPAVPDGNTLLAGQWRGGCFPKSCVELGTTSSWPTECALE